MAADHPVGFLVAAEQCDQCLLSPHRIVSGRRMADLLADSARKDSFFVCHKFTMAHIADPSAPEHVCCRAFYDLDPMACTVMQIGARLNRVHFIPVPDVGKG